jgi:NADH-quinone oxidoreductase subunit I
MAVKVVRRPELTFWEELYVPQILCGLKITFAHFFRNLFLHAAHRVGRFKAIPAAATIQFPEELRPLMSRFRSRHRLTHREDHTPRCVGCMLCETVCPAKCITIVPGEHPDPNIEKYPVRFDIDLGPASIAGTVSRYARRTQSGWTQESLTWRPTQERPCDLTSMS